MKKAKLTLESLSVESFTTDQRAKRLKGGAPLSWPTNCPIGSYCVRLCNSNDFQCGSNDLQCETIAC